MAKNNGSYSVFREAKKQVTFPQVPAKKNGYVARVQASAQASGKKVEEKKAS